MCARHFKTAFLWLVFITIISVMPGVQLPKFELFSVDKLAHAIVYGMLVWLTVRAFAKNADRPTATPAEGLAAFLFAALYGMLMEWVQGTFFPGRFFEFDDMIANTIGAAVAWAGSFLGKK